MSDNEVGKESKWTQTSAAAYGHPSPTDDEIDKYVRKAYGDNSDWVLLGQEKGYKVIDILNDFVTLDDDGNKHIGIVIVKGG